MKAQLCEDCGEALVLKKRKRCKRCGLLVCDECIRYHPGWEWCELAAVDDVGAAPHVANHRSPFGMFS